MFGPAAQCKQAINSEPVVSEMAINANYPKNPEDSNTRELGRGDAMIGIRIHVGILKRMPFPAVARSSPD
jgi:hypothetical protein